MAVRLLRCLLRLPLAACSSLCCTSGAHWGGECVVEALQGLSAATRRPPPPPRPKPATPGKQTPSVLAIVARRNDMNMLESFIQVCGLEH